MVVLITSTEDLQQKLADAGDKLVVLDFFATWCAPCKNIAPKLQELSESMSDVLFYKIDIDECEDLVNEYSVTSMPTFVFIKNGKKLESFPGANEERLLKTIQKHK